MAARLVVWHWGRLRDWCGGDVYGGVVEVRLAATGHRPDKLGGYSEAIDSRLRHLARTAIETLEPSQCISGMALGWDMAFAEAAIEVGVPLCAALPFVGQESLWPEASQRRYAGILARAASVVTVCPPIYSAKKMILRDEWMVDNADMLLALWNGTRGGTYHTVHYAERRKLPICNLWDLF